MDAWILSRLSNAVGAVDAGFAAYKFHCVTTALYNFWLYELCDIYLEAIKPLMRTDEEGADARKEATRQVKQYFRFKVY